jgi:hypothetical protein
MQPPHIRVTMRRNESAELKRARITRLLSAYRCQ